MTSDPTQVGTLSAESPEHQSVDEKKSPEVKHLDNVNTDSGNLVYEDEEEPEIHLPTYLALIAMFFLNLVQVFALQGPSAVVSGSL